MRQALREVDAVSSHAGNGEEMAPFLFAVDQQKQAHLQLPDLFEHQTYYVDITLVGLDEVGSIAAKVSCYCLHARCDKAAEHHLRVKMSVEESGLFKKSILITEEATRRPLLILSLNAKVKKNNFHLDRKYLIMSSLYPDARHVHFTSDRPGVSLRKAESTDERVRVRILNRDEDGALCEIRTTPSEERPMRGVSSILCPGKTCVIEGVYHYPASGRKAAKVFVIPSDPNVPSAGLTVAGVATVELVVDRKQLVLEFGGGSSTPVVRNIHVHAFSDESGAASRPTAVTSSVPWLKARIHEKPLKYGASQLSEIETWVITIEGSRPLGPGKHKGLLTIRTNAENSQMKELYVHVLTDVPEFDSYGWGGLRTSKGHLYVRMQESHSLDVDRWQTKDGDKVGFPTCVG